MIFPQKSQLFDQIQKIPGGKKELIHVELAKV